MEQEPSCVSSTVGADELIVEVVGVCARICCKLPPFVVKLCLSKSVVELAQGFFGATETGRCAGIGTHGFQSVLTTSVIHAGPDVVPAHYVAFCEALLKACNPYFWPGEWKIAAGEKPTVTSFTNRGTGNRPCSPKSGLNWWMTAMKAVR